VVGSLKAYPMRTRLEGGRSLLLCLRRPDAYWGAWKRLKPFEQAASRSSLEDWKCELLKDGLIAALQFMMKRLRPDGQ
jgi:hypothetical protein